ncbi:MAG: lysine decarboxylase, partial [Deltaproteobacteria bacterium]|nr:lysine decarboxylase [Deltaproteobacteria bacterium]
FELLPLLQTKKVEKTIPIILFGTEYWERVFNFDVLVEWGLINEKDLSLFRFFDDVDEAFVYLRDTLTEHYLKD